MSMYSEEFYFGANTAKGFVSLYDKMAQNDKIKKMFVIKGGPGTGKSSLLRKIGEEFSEKYNIEYGFCSSDPDSLDVVNIQDLGVCIVDGTPPHPVEPRFPGALESIVDLYPLFNEDSLMQSLDEIKTVSQRCSKLHEKALKYISVASIISENNISMQDEAFLRDKADLFVKRLIKQKIKNNLGKGSEKVRFLSAVTPKGVNVLNISGYTDVCVIEDEHKRVSSFILEKIRNALLEYGYEFITCYCILFPFEKIEHIFVPQLKLAFLTSNSYHKFQNADSFNVIRAKRFLDENVMRTNKQKLKFNSTVKKEMITEAVKIMKQAKITHDLLEKLYIKNVSFDKMSELIEKLTEKINRISKL